MVDVYLNKVRKDSPSLSNDSVFSTDLSLGHFHWPRAPVSQLHKAIWRSHCRSLYWKDEQEHSILASRETSGKGNIMATVYFLYNPFTNWQSSAHMADIFTVDSTLSF